MGDRQSRFFEGTYTSNDNKKYKVKISLNYTRLLALALSLVLVRGGLSKLSNMQNALMLDNASISASFETESKKLIEQIIANKKNIFEEEVLQTYAVKDGDTLESISLNHGCSVQRLNELNGVPAGTALSGGSTITVESKREKSPLDKSIALLESYFYDYMFNSPAAELAKNPESKGSSLYKLLIYGEPKSDADIDPNSIYGTYVGFYLKFHELDNPTDEAKTAYVDFLMMLARDAEHKLNIGSKNSIVYSFESYADFMKRGTTEAVRVQVIGQTI